MIRFKQTILLLVSLVPLVGSAQSNTLYVNDLKVKVVNHPDSTASYGIDIHSKQGETLVYKLGLWIGGKVNGELRTAVQTFGQNGADFTSGPLNITTGKTKDERIRSYAHVWAITRFEIEEFKNKGIISPNIRDWPAGVNRKQSKGQESANMAPFVDINSNGLYEPEKGDYPRIKGDQMLWWVYNDRGEDRATQNSIGVEIQATAYVYYCDTITTGSAIEALNKAVFFEFDIINRSQDEVDSLYLGSFMDGDISEPNHVASLAGCDSNLNVAYNYARNFGSLSKKAILNMKYLGDDKTPLQVNSIISYSNNAGFLGNPIAAADFYHYLQGKDKNGKSYSTRYWFQTDIKSDTRQTPMDVRSVMSAGPIRLKPGEIVPYNFAIILTESTLPIKESVDINTASLRLLDSFYVTDSFPVCRRFPTGISNQANQKKVHVFPNPTSGQLNFSNVNPTEIFWVTITDLNGKIVFTTRQRLNKPLNLTSLSNGVYIANLRGGRSIRNIKFMVQK